jgi:hypothetical protein
MPRSFVLLSIEKIKSVRFRHCERSLRSNLLLYKQIFP